MDYRRLVKATYQHIASKRFRSYLLLFYRKNHKIAVSGEQLRGWEAILGEISRQQRLPHESRGNKNRFDNCLINFKGFQLKTEGLTHIEPQLRQQLLHIFMRVQISYIHSADSLKDQVLFRLLSTLQPKKAAFFMDYYCKKIPKQKLGERMVAIPTIGSWPSLFGVID